MAIQQKIPTPQEVKSSPTSFTEQERIFLLFIPLEQTTSTGKISLQL